MYVCCWRGTDRRSNSIDLCMRGRNDFQNVACFFHIVGLFRTEVCIFAIHVRRSIHGVEKFGKFILFLRLLLEGSLAYASKLANLSSQNHLGHAQYVSSLKTLLWCVFEVTTALSLPTPHSRYCTSLK